MLQRILCFAFLAFLAVPLPAAANERKAAEPKIVLERVPPKSPAEAMATFEVADGFRIEQVAAEPLVVDPVAMAFDERGRLYVVEMVDYSERGSDRLGRIRLLEDTDGDGRFDKSHVFAEDLSWPTAVICYDSGIFVGNAPHIVYLKDTDGDGVAEPPRIVYSGFNRGNVQALINSFQWGLDNRIHGSSSTGGGKITTHGVQQEPLDLSGRNFAFDPKTLEIEATTGGGQHGMTFNRWGDRFVCHNSDHLQAIVFEERYLARNPYQSILSARRSIAADGPQAAVYRASPIEAWRIARTKMRLAGQASGPIEGGGAPAGYFTSATGVTVYEGGMWGTHDTRPERADDVAGNGPGSHSQSGDEAWVFVADVGSNLIHRKKLTPDGVTYIGRRVDQNSEFVRSTDIWFRPVQMAIGPEGALYVADMYREVIEHPLSLPPELKEQLDLNSGNDRGRIYRIVPSQYKYEPPPTLADATTEQLVNELAHANAWRRATAARLLYERPDPAAVPLLRAMLSSAQWPETRIAALYALKSAGSLELGHVIASLDDQHPQVRRHALRLSEPFLDSSAELLNKVLSLASNSEPVVKFQLALSLGSSNSEQATEALAELITSHVEQRDIVDAALTSIATRAGAVLEQLLADEKWLAESHAPPVLSAVVGQIVRQRRDGDLEVLLAALNSPRGSGSVVPQLLKALSKAPPSALAKADSPQMAELRRLRDHAAAQLVKDARKLLERDDSPIEARLAAIENLAFGSFGDERDLLEALLSPQQPAAVHATVLRSCAEFEAPAVGELILDQWDQFAPTERLQATEVLLRRKKWALQLLRYLKENNLPLTTLDPGHVARLVNYPSAEASKLARELRGKHVAEDRKKVFDEYRDAALAGGDVANGKLVFEKNCASCHQLGEVGQPIGPNLVSMIGRGADSVLFNILAPSGEVDPRYLEYVVVTADGQVLTGIVAGETSTAVTLRNAENKLITVLRVDIEEMRNTGKSLMPDGFEKLIEKPAMADLLTYLQETAASEGASK